MAQISGTEHDLRSCRRINSRARAERGSVAGGREGWRGSLGAGLSKPPQSAGYSNACDQRPVSERNPSVAGTAIADRHGNNRLDTFENLLVHPEICLLAQARVYRALSLVLRREGITEFGANAATDVVILTTMPPALLMHRELIA